MLDKVIYRQNYKPLDFFVSNVKLYFNIISFNKIEVISELMIVKNHECNENLVRLNGEDLETIYVKLDNKLLDENKEYFIEDNILKIYSSNSSFTIETKVVINPEANTKLMGIYKSQNILCSQCEPEGFRKITWFIDRPDNMCKWDVSIEANKNEFPILLSNGNKINTEDISNSKHVAHFNDPFNKPSYLFAFIAGDFDCLSDIYTTSISNKEVNLNIYVEKGKKYQAIHAMNSLKKAMLWDEKVYTLEYDLNIFNIVAVRDFNFGAMENKSLNIFNEIYILADPKLITDNEFYAIEAVVAHEYFHNWTGDRVTCRDWFQLTLKEGLTVFRDHTFSEDNHYKDCSRIIEVEGLRRRQFAEDNSPLSHPIRPDQYIEINNFYTATIYEKGSEVIRMIRTIIGEENFKKGMKVYFDNFDGKAVTCDDFVWSMEKASGYDLTRFKKWYSQSGTPVVLVKFNYDSINKNYSLYLEQDNLHTNNQIHKDNLVIPLKLSLFDNEGKQINLISNSKDMGKVTTILLEEKTKEIIFDKVSVSPSLSINRFFSAPVIIKCDQSLDELKSLIRYDNDGMTKFDASRRYFNKYILKIIDDVINNKEIIIDNTIFEPIKDLLINENINNYLLSMIIRIPNFDNISQLYNENIPVKEIYKAINILKLKMSNILEKVLLEKYSMIDNDNPVSIEKEDYAKRALKNTILEYLVKLNKKEYFELANAQYEKNDNMTSKVGVLIALKDYIGTQERDIIFRRFYSQYESEVLVINKLLSIEAMSENYAILDKINTIINDNKLFSWYNPNKVNALIRVFSQNNSFVFHNDTGIAYQFLANAIIKLDDINSSIAASLSTSFLGLNKYPKLNQDLMKSVMQNIINKPKLSKGVFEIISKILKD